MSCYPPGAVKFYSRFMAVHLVVVETFHSKLQWYLQTWALYLPILACWDTAAMAAM